MKWLLTPLLWVLALTLAGVTVYRLWRGKPIILRGRWSARVLRMVAIILVVLGFGAGESSAQVRGRAPVKPKSSDPSPEPAPPLTLLDVQHWVTNLQTQPQWTLCKQLYTACMLEGKPTPVTLKQFQNYARNIPLKLREMLQADIDGLNSGKELVKPTIAKLTQTLKEIEAGGYFDLWLTAYLWRQAAHAEGDAKAKIAFYDQLAENALKTTALIKAHAAKGGMLMGPRAWMSKAGPRPGQMQLHQIAIQQVTAEAVKLYYKVDLGTWVKDGMAAFSIEKDGGSATYYQAGYRKEIEGGAKFRFHRLDLVQTAESKPVTFTHATYDKVTIPGGKLVSAHDLPEYVSETGKKKIADDIAASLKGNDDAATRLEKALPLVHTQLRKELKANPSAKGSAKMRLILALFDDAVMLFVHLTPTTLYGGGAFGGRGGR